MASITTSLLGMLNLSPAEKAFRPWWDDMENFAVYSMIIISILVAPGGFILETNMECNRCQGKECCEWSWINSYSGSGCDVPDVTGEKEYNAWFVRRYCLNNPSDGYYGEGLHIPGYILYFQYILLGMSAILIILDRPFVMVLFRSLNVDQIHKLIVTDDPYTDKIDRKKEIHEIVSCLGSVGNYYLSYMTRTVISLITSVIMISLILCYQLMDPYTNAYICRVHSRIYECTGHPTNFYLTTGYIFVGLLCVYLLLNAYNFAWIVASGHFSPLDSVMTKFKESGSVSPCLKRIYYNNRNVRLLLCLLSTSSGLSSPLRALALIDKKLKESLIPSIQIFDQKQNSKHLKLLIKPETLLGYISARKDCYATYCVENGSQIEHFTETCSSLDMILENNEMSGGILKISTSLNGRIVGSKQMIINPDEFNLQTNGVLMQEDHIVGWQQLN